MDPNECLKMFHDAMMKRDRSGVAEAADNLVGWLEKGGFLPSFDQSDRRSELSREDLVAYFRDIRHVAEML